MNRLALGAIAATALLGVAGGARAQTSLYDPVVFTAVDGVRYDGGNVYVTGIVQGETTAREVLFTSSYSYVEYRASCERLILLAMTKPGQYLLTMQRVSGNVIVKCAVSRVAP